MNKIKRYRLQLLLAAGLFVFVQSLPADILKYTDREGRIYFTDRPLKGDGYQLIKIKRTGTGSMPSYDASRLKKNRARFAHLIEATAKRFGLQPSLLHAMVAVESAYDPNALSSTGAMGLMQLMPATAKHMGVDDGWDPKQNLDGGARYMKGLLETFDFDLKLALAAYNAGESAVKRYGNSIPPFPETQRYVRKVLSRYNNGVE